MEAKEGYYKVVVWVKGRAKALTGIRKYLAYSMDDVYSEVNKSLTRYYYPDDILKIDVTKLDARSIEIAEWLSKKNTRR